MKTSGPGSVVGPRARWKIAGWEILTALCLCLWLAPSAWAAASAPGDDEASSEASSETWTALASVLTTGGSYRVEIESDPHPLPLNEMFSLRFRVFEAAGAEDAEDAGAEDADADDGEEKADLVSGAVVTASARMPEHQHGTHFEPRVTSHGDGTATGVGFLWHMEGQWALRVGVAADGKMEWAAVSFELEP